jgi:hypothetical protein
VNGALGYVRAFVWKNPFPEYHRTLPNFILEEMDQYNDPPFLPDRPRIVPIPVYKREFVVHDGLVACVREQFPFASRLGMTLDKAVIDIGLGKEMVAELTFVISGVRRSDVLLLKISCGHE